MESLQIKTGMLAVNILDDFGEVRGVFKFNPKDIKVGQKMFDMIMDFEVKKKEFNEKQKKCETPEESLALLNEVVSYNKEMIDSIWGEGSSEILFGDAVSLTMLEDFFAGITPYYQKESAKRTAKYKK